NFFVRHYADEAMQTRDPKYRAGQGGVLYPRAATVGGCTAHNAMILVYPHNNDWDRIADTLGDPSWSSAAMRRYFERIERCEYPVSFNPASRHGFSGWLATTVADPLLMVRDAFLRTLVGATARESLTSSSRPLSGLAEDLASRFDPNDWRSVTSGDEG